MSAVTLSPPQPPVCLRRSYLSRGIKGGTVIAEDVVDVEQHGQRVVHPDGYRCYVAPCLRCGHGLVHGLCFRERLPRPATPDQPIEAVTIRLFRCASKACKAVFTVLPAFLARHLWRTWETVQNSVQGRETPPRSTLRRWLARYRCDASQPVQVFTSSVRGPVTKVLKRVRPLTRADFIQALTPLLPPARRIFASLAAWIHRLSAGIRLM